MKSHKYMASSIYSYQELLQEILLKGKLEIEAHNEIIHGPTIGSMYEGLSKDIMGRSSFRGLNLRVTSGFIRNSKNELSRQIDGMVVCGEGEKIPYSDNYEYNIGDVIMVVEVKKRLNMTELSKAYDNLYSVYKLHEDTDVNRRLLADAFESITGYALPEVENIDVLPYGPKCVYGILSQEVSLPIRVIWGYEGYKNSKRFLKSFENMLRKVTTDDTTVIGQYKYKPVA